MPWTATPFVWTIRWGDHHRIYGDPFEGVATLTRCGDMAYISATCGDKLQIVEVREFFEFCRDNGMSQIAWNHNGRSKEVEK